MEDLWSAERYLRVAGEREKSERAHTLALETAKEWAQSDYELESEIGQTYVYMFTGQRHKLWENQPAG